MLVTSVAHSVSVNSVLEDPPTRVRSHMSTSAWGDYIVCVALYTYNQCVIYIKRYINVRFGFTGRHINSRAVA